MKVLQINALYGHGSTGTIVRDIERLCYSNLIECYVASPDPNVHGAKKGYLIGGVLDHKIHALLCRINGKQAYYSKNSTKRLLTYMDSIRPDVVHLHNLHSNYIHLPLLLSYLAKKDIATIITLHDCWFYTGGCFHYTLADCNGWKIECGACPKKMQDTPAYLFDKSTEILEDRKRYLLAIKRLMITGVSEWISNEARKSFLRERPIETIYNGIDLDVFKHTPSSLRQRLGLVGKYVILGPASKWLSPINQDALKYVSEGLNESEVLLLYGAQDVTRRTPNHVKLYGYTKDRTELAALYSMADVFVNCSREESLSLINLEAQSCETPIVTYGITGMMDTVNESDSYSVPPGNYVELLKRIRQIQSDNKYQRGQSCRSFIREKFGIEDNYIKYINSYKRFVMREDK